MNRFRKSKYSFICVITLCLLLVGCTRARPEPDLTIGLGTPVLGGTPAPQDAGQATSIAIYPTDTPASADQNKNSNTALSTTSNATIDNSSTEAPAVSAPVSITSETTPNTDGSSNVAVHTVQPGESLFRIALTYNVDVDELVSINSLSSPDVIYAGQEIKVPGLASVGDGAGNVYIVQSGDTLSSIAFRYGTTTQNILFENTLDSADLIYIGQRLAIP